MLRPCPFFVEGRLETLREIRSVNAQGDAAVLGTEHAGDDGLPESETVPRKQRFCLCTGAAAPGLLRVPRAGNAVAVPWEARRVWQLQAAQFRVGAAL